MSRIFFALIFLISAPSFAQNNIKNLYDKVNPSVVELHVKSVSEPQKGQVNFKASTKKALGSGALINNDGDILTAAHVVGRATEIEVIFANGHKTSGHVLWIDTLIDVAMIRARRLPAGVQPLLLAAPKDYSVGEQVMAIGAPLGNSHSLSVGYLSGIRDKQTIPGTDITPRLIQTDAAINQGNSGGPLFNMQGDVIGIVSHILSKSGGSDGLGFAVSVDTIQKVIDGEPRIFLGLIPHLLTQKEAFAINNHLGYGILIQQVIPGSAAHKFGFKGGDLLVSIGRNHVLLGGDIILSLDDIPLKNIASAMRAKRYVKKLAKGDKIRIEYLRKGEVESGLWVIE